MLLVGSDVEGCDFDFVGVIAGGVANEFESFAGVDDVIDDEEAFGVDVQGVERSCFFDELGAGFAAHVFAVVMLDSDGLDESHVERVGEYGGGY